MLIVGKAKLMRKSSIICLDNFQHDLRMLLNHYRIQKINLEREEKEID